MPKFRTIYAEADDGSILLAPGADRRKYRNGNGVVAGAVRRQPRRSRVTHAVDNRDTA